MPFFLVDPDGDRRRNAVVLYSKVGAISQQMPESVTLPCRSSAKAIHLLGAVAASAAPHGEKGSVSLIVRLHYADGSTEDHQLKNGVHIADYSRAVDVPESELAFRLGDRQVRYLAIEPKRADMIESVELVKGPMPPLRSYWQ